MKNALISRCACGHPTYRHEWTSDNAFCWLCTCPDFTNDNLIYLEFKDKERDESKTAGK